MFILFMVALCGGGFALGLLAHEFIKDFKMWVIIVVTVIVLLLLMVFLTTNLKINGWLITAIAADLILPGGIGYVTREKQWV